MRRRRRLPARLARVAVLAAALVASACFGRVCTRQRVAYTDADGVAYWTVLACAPRVTLRAASAPVGPR